MLVVEVPTQTKRGTTKYSAATMFGFVTGDKYPCAFADGLSVLNGKHPICIFEAGDISSFGQPMRIYISNFYYTANTTLNLSLIV